MEFINFFSVVLNFIGTIIVAFSVIENPENAHQIMNGKKIYLASILLDKFRLGICLIIIGFLLQLPSFLNTLHMSIPGLLAQNVLFRLAFCALIFIIGNIAIRNVYGRLRNYYIIKNSKDIPYQRAAAWVGYIESFTYVCAYYLNHPQFIAVWLGVKAIGRWSSHGPESVVDLIPELENKPIEKRERKNAEINIYLIGNLLSIILSVFVAIMLKVQVY